MEPEISSRLGAIEKLLTEHFQQQKQVLNFQETCRYLSVSASHLYKLTSDKRIPHFCPQGKKLYFNRLALDQWLQRNPCESSDEIEKEAINYIIRNTRK